MRPIRRGPVLDTLVWVLVLGLTAAVLVAGAPARAWLFEVLPDWPTVSPTQRRLTVTPTS